VSPSCPKCGAAGKGFVCAFCGGELAKPGDDDADMRALEEFHKHIHAAAADPQRCSLLITGWYPTSKKALIEAGARCLPHLDINEACRQQYRKRLETLISRVKMLPPDEQSKNAAAELSAKLAAFDAQESSDLKHGLILIGGLAALVVAVGWKVLSYFMR
jgi:hypothetical protein